MEYDFKDFGTADTVDDWTQEVTINVWLQLKNGRFEGAPADFYSWMQKIAFNKASKSFNKLAEKKANKVPQFVKNEEDDDEEENSHILSQPGGYSF